MFQAESSRRVIRSTLIALSWVPVLLTINNNVVHIAQIRGTSMQPTLNPHTETLATDWVLLWKLGVKNPASLSRDDVILFKAPTNPRKVYCKRVKGLPFDTIDTKFPYPKSQVNLPRGHVWAEGDNLFHSIDSNTFGSISSGLVMGKVVAIVWPPSRWGSDLKLSTGRNCIARRAVAE
ncbi:Mitochondrial inner membrane peptidase complex subunit [Saccharomyces pastorianus]|uniref:Mitochondrial inner membrane protease subunit 2 n=1 Tax=Saccharomyces pastorianus TaxID=27292 RepID=A0A6C1EED5_SACPS|nr:Mitochondrial inner membrane peptidase complex subunit [Saccharomyces pastorianus]